MPDSKGPVDVALMQELKLYPMLKCNISNQKRRSCYKKIGESLSLSTAEVISKAAHLRKQYHDGRLDESIMDLAAEAFEKTEDDALKWSKDDTAKLIQLVGPLHRRGQPKKADFWESIAEQIGHDAKQCSVRWNNLFNVFRYRSTVPGIFSQQEWHQLWQCVRGDSPSSTATLTNWEPVLPTDSPSTSGSLVSQHRVDSMEQEMRTLSDENIELDECIDRLLKRRRQLENYIDDRDADKKGRATPQQVGRFEIDRRGSDGVIIQTPSLRVVLNGDHVGVRAMNMPGDYILAETSGALSVLRLATRSTEQTRKPPVMATARIMSQRSINISAAISDGSKPVRMDAPGSTTGARKRKSLAPSRSPSDAPRVYNKLEQ